MRKARVFRKAGRFIILGLLCQASLYSFATSPRLATDESGNAVCVAFDHNGVQVYYNSDPVNQAWIGPQLISGALYSPQIIDTAEIAYAGNGRFVAAWIRNASEMAMGKVFCATSSDGQNWSTPFSVGDSYIKSETRNLALSGNGQGTVILTWAGNDLSVMSAQSTDFGEHFTTPSPAPPFGVQSTFDRFYLSNESGIWYRTYTRTNSGLVNVGTGVVETSLDNGLTWGNRQEFGAYWYGRDVTHGLFNLGNQVIIPYKSRVNPDSITNSAFKSIDSGLNWDSENFLTEYTDFKNMDFAHAASGDRVAVFEDGSRIVAIYGNTAEVDEWSSVAVEVASDSNLGLQNPDIISTGNNTFITAYNAGGGGGTLPPPFPPSPQSPLPLIRTAISTDGGITWGAGADMPVDQTQAPSLGESPVVIVPGSVKIKSKTPKPGKPRKFTINLKLANESESNVIPETTYIIYLADNADVAPEDQVGTAIVKQIKIGKSGKLKFKSNNFPDFAGKSLILQAEGTEPIIIPIS